MKISKTLTLLAAVAAITTASAELPTRSEREFYVAPGTKRQTYRNTQEIRTINSDRRQRETEAMGGEFKAVVERVQLGLEAKFGNAAEALSILTLSNMIVICMQHSLSANTTSRIPQATSTNCRNTSQRPCRRKQLLHRKRQLLCRREPST